jgi:hypothetical protein
VKTLNAQMRTRYHPSGSGECERTWQTKLAATTVWRSSWALRKTLSAGSGVTMSRGSDSRDVHENIRSSVEQTTQPTPQFSRMDFPHTQTLCLTELSVLLHDRCDSHIRYLYSHDGCAHSRIEKLSIRGASYELHLEFFGFHCN